MEQGRSRTELYWVPAGHAHLAQRFAIDPAFGERLAGLLNVKGGIDVVTIDERAVADVDWERLQAISVENRIDQRLGSTDVGPGEIDLGGRAAAPLALTSRPGAATC